MLIIIEHIMWPAPRADKMTEENHVLLLQQARWRLRRPNMILKWPDRTLLNFRIIEDLKTVLSFSLGDKKILY